MDVSRMRRRITYGVTGLFVVLFALTGLAFSYGLGHPPPSATCLLHGGPVSGAEGSGVLAMDEAPQGPAPAVSTDVCLFLAVLITFLALGMAVRPRRWVVRPKRFGWTLSPPAARSALPRSPAALQVLRL